ncbi:MAG: hypothetical protein NWR30_08715, partial [Salibacteraceae bacterium]|nr:hypothetical protein [Salibacteraceae bacterium]
KTSLSHRVAFAKGCIEMDIGKFKINYNLVPKSHYQKKQQTTHYPLSTDHSQTAAHSKTVHLQINRHHNNIWRIGRKAK